MEEQIVEKKYKCSGCKQELIKDLFYVDKRNTSRDFATYRCKACSIRQTIKSTNKTKKNKKPQDFGFGYGD